MLPPLASGSNAGGFIRIVASGGGVMSRYLTNCCADVEFRSTSSSGTLVRALENISPEQSCFCFPR